MDKAEASESDTEGESPYCHSPAFEIAAAGHSFAFYPDGADRLKALVKMIEETRKSLQIFYYLFAGDKAGTAVRDALVAAAKRGVTVQLIVDDFGNDAGAAFFEPLIEAGGTFAIFSPRLSKYYFVRNHQKFAISDGARVMTGGANVSDHYFNPPVDNGWCDLSVIIEGPVTVKFAEWFEVLRGWTDAEAKGWVSKLRSLRDVVHRWDGGDGPVRLLVGGPLARRGHWSWCLRQDLVGAERLDTVSAYFSPPRSFRRKFAMIARRGKVRMIMPGKSDFSAAIGIARLLYGKLLEAGAQIFEFQPCKLHMKMLVIDDISYLGSANLDKRSFRINVELMVRIEDAAMAARMRKLIDHLEAASEFVSRDTYARQATLLTRVRWRLAYILSLADYRMSRSLSG
jgi:cardiolipin synthase A/B